MEARSSRQPIQPNETPYQPAQVNKLKSSDQIYIIDRASYQYRPITLVLPPLLKSRNRRKFEKQPSHTMVREACATISVPLLFLYRTPLIVPFSLIREVTVPRSNFTLNNII